MAATLLKVVERRRKDGPPGVTRLNRPGIFQPAEERVGRVDMEPRLPVGSEQLAWKLFFDVDHELCHQWIGVEP